VISAYSSFDQKTRMPKFRSNRKIEFVNPFFFHAFRGYLTNPAGDYFSMAKGHSCLMMSIKQLFRRLLSATTLFPGLLTTTSLPICSTFCNSVFYVKNAQGKTIDFAVWLPDGFVPGTSVEVKYQNSIANSDYRNLRKFERGRTFAESL